MSTNTTPTNDGDVTASFVITRRQKARLQELSDGLGRSASASVREALDLWIERQERQAQMMAELDAELAEATA